MLSLQAEDVLALMSNHMEHILISVLGSPQDHLPPHDQPPFTHQPMQTSSSCFPSSHHLPCIKPSSPLAISLRPTPIHPLSPTLPHLLRLHPPHTPPHILPFPSPKLQKPYLSPAPSPFPSPAWHLQSISSRWTPMSVKLIYTYLPQSKSADLLTRVASESCARYLRVGVVEFMSPRA